MNDFDYFRPLEVTDTDSPAEHEEAPLIKLTFN